MFTGTVTYQKSNGDIRTCVVEHEKHDMVYAMTLGAVKGALMGVSATLISIDIEEV